MKNNLSIVIATLNEEGNIQELYNEIDNNLKKIDITWEIIFVDDDSSDRTVDIINQLRDKYDNVFLIKRYDKRGLSSALITGALSSNSNYILFMDADLQHNPKYIIDLYNRIKNSNYHLVSASRFMNNKKILNNKRYRLSNLVNIILQKLFNIKYNDILTGYFIIEKKFFLKHLRKFSSKGFKILLDIILSTKHLIKYDEIPFNFQPRFSGTSKLNNKIVIDFVYLVLDKTIGKFIPARYIIYSFVGLTGAFFQLLSFYFLFKILNFNLSLIISIIIAMSINFILNNEFTYSDLKLKRLNFFYGLIKFYFFCSFGALFNFLTAKLTFEYSSIIFFSIFLGALVGSIWNYSMNKSFNWKDV